MAASALLALPASAIAFGPLSSFSSVGEGAGQTNGVGILGIAADGTILVPDLENHRIDVFDPQGGSSTPSARK
jgi:hypothetical protein